MIIWGSKGRERDVGDGEFYCPTCETVRNYKRKKVGKYFTLYFVPLFETETVGEYIECQFCKQVFKPTVLNYEPPSPAEQVLTAVRRELEGGMPCHMVQKKLTSLGLDEEGASLIVDIVTVGYQKTCSNCGFKYIASVQSCSNCGYSLQVAQNSPYGTSNLDSLRLKGNSGNNRPAAIQSPMSREVQELYVELDSDSAKRREATINRLAKKNIQDERILMKIANMAMQDNMEYVRVAAEKYLETPAAAAMLREIEARNREDQLSVREVHRILQSRGLV